MPAPNPVLAWKLMPSLWVAPILAYRALFAARRGNSETRMALANFAIWVAYQTRWATSLLLIAFAPSAIFVKA
jgi:hypothetical protein